ncbi:jg2278 [Pararge aegeria aegeria]|uniref:Jg2278 protein n=1 Tax=Pararge aegeria aegeria TaxID=348720 RepID=A0A8S4RRM8_9NEOP|nr:jg2278 [Pararge aegeria aegeria]
MEEKRSWTCEEVLSLIEQFQKHPSLWDGRSVYYKSKMKKQDAYKEMAATFQTTTTEVDRKIKNIISQYQRERRNYKKVKSMGVGGSFRAKWFGYHAMSFLHEKPRRGGEVGGEYQDSESDDDETLSDIRNHSHAAVDEVEMPFMLCEVGMENIAEEEIQSKQDVFKPPRVSTKKEVTRNEEKHDAKSLFKLLESAGTITPRDESDVFGEMVAQNLKRLKTEYAKITVQNRINNLLYEARLGCYDSPQSGALFANLATSSTTSDPT